MTRLSAYLVFLDDFMTFNTSTTGISTRPSGMCNGVMDIEVALSASQDEECI